MLCVNVTKCRTLHGALLDAEILADVYLRMTGGQVTLSLGDASNDGEADTQVIQRISADRAPLKVIIMLVGCRIT